MLISSFDIGKKNFSFYVEDIDEECIPDNNIDLKSRYEENGIPTEDFNIVLKKFFKHGKKILLENIDITKNCDPNVKLDPETFHNMTEVLDKYKDIWDKCKVFIIEKQMQFGTRINPMAMKLGQHCYSYFAIHYGKTKDIIEFPAYYKTQILGAEKIPTKKSKTGKQLYKTIDKPARKKWCVSKALEILKSREYENESVEKIEKSRKKDDLCDVICQLQAWKIINL